MNKPKFTPVTPGGTYLEQLTRATRDEAIKALMKDAAHMPYKTWAAFERRGYQIVEG